MWNLASVLLGLLALGIPVLGMGLFEHDRPKGRYACSAVSFACCLGALVCQLFEVHRRVALRDWTALEDTISVLAKPWAVLSLVVVVLNLIALYTCIRRQKAA